MFLLFYILNICPIALKAKYLTFKVDFNYLPKSLSLFFTFLTLLINYSHLKYLKALKGKMLHNLFKYSFLTLLHEIFSYFPLMCLLGNRWNLTRNSNFPFQTFYLVFYALMALNIWHFSLAVSLSSSIYLITSQATQITLKTTQFSP